MSIGSDTVMTVALDSHQIPYYLPGKKPFVPYFRYSVKDKYSIKGEEMQEGKGYYENKKTRCVDTSFQVVEKVCIYKNRANSLSLSPNPFPSGRG